MAEPVKDKVNYYHNDEWSINDELGLTGASERLARMALQVSPPFSISVNGKWGSGKTSIMRRAFMTLGGCPASQAVLLGEEKREIDQQENDWELSIINKKGLTNQIRRNLLTKKYQWERANFNAADESLVVWYSPWQHQNSDNPLISLLLEVRNQYEARHKLLDKTKNITRQGGLAALTLLERAIDAALIVTKATKRPLVTGTTDAVRKAWKSGDHSTKFTDGQRFHLQFEDAVEIALQSLDKKTRTKKADSKARLIIFIDDLDRCEESIVVNLLEAIKLYLGTSRCVFVLGLDNNAILRALGNHWSSRSEDYNREYLEKLFQATIRIPRPRPLQAKELIAKQLKVHNIPEAERFACVICGLIEPNPRKLKNFTNSICATWCLHTIPHTKEDDLNNDTETPNREILQLILLQYLVLYHPALWRILERQPWSLKIMFGVLTGNETDPHNLPEGFLDSDQHIMKHFFARSFSHVLKQGMKEDGIAEDGDKHRGMGLDSAVDLFLERIDRKHSDEFFIKHIDKAFVRDDEVPEHLLTLSGDD